MMSFRAYLENRAGGKKKKARTEDTAFSTIKDILHQMIIS